MQNFAQYTVRATRLVSVFLADFAVNALKVVDDQSTIKGLAFRAIALMQSLARLDQVVDVQLVVAANRAMLELVVDLTLLMHYQPSEGIEKLEAWELSAKYNYALQAVNYVKNNSGKLSAVEQPLADFVNREEDNVRNIRQRCWPAKHGRSTHPNRWTGRDLLRDVQEADRLHGSHLELSYQSDYRRMNLQLHGSTLAGYRSLNLEGFEVAFALGHKRTSELALEASRSPSDNSISLTIPRELHSRD